MSKLPPHIERVVQEKIELDIKLSNLMKFTDNSLLFNKVSSPEQALLLAQQAKMKEYSDILGTRIALYEPSSSA